MGRNGNGCLPEFRQTLLSRRDDMAASLGIRFDTLARLGRVAEEDKALLTHEEFISVHRNGIYYEQLRLIEDALRRLDAGQYGVCQSCDDRIPEKRLRALPWARYCLTCQEHHAGQNSTDPEPAVDTVRGG